MIWATVCGCGRAAVGAPCVRCRALLRPAPPPDPVPGLDAVAALVAYAGVGRGLVTSVKYRNRRAALDWLGPHLARVACRWPIDIVTWVPSTPMHRRQRGFDQGALLADRVGSALGLPVESLLVRDGGAAQTNRPMTERRSGPPLRGGRAVDALAGLSVLVVDDVGTTGSSLRVAAQTLRAAGAVGVRAVTVAWTPRKESGAAGARAKGLGRAASGHDRLIPTAPRGGPIGGHRHQ
jgi:predicted amidophosphoribosyltransferase